MIKVFWWGDVDDLSGMTPYLHYLNENEVPIIEYGDIASRLRELVRDGYTEISRRTAYRMGLPI